MSAKLVNSDAAMSDQHGNTEEQGAGISGAPSPEPLDRAARAQRDADVARLRARGVPWEEVADRAGLSVRQAQRARLNHIQRAAMYAALPEDPNAVLQEAVEHHRAALVDLARLSREADNSNASMAAARARAQVSAGLVKLLADAGVLPNSARAWTFIRRDGEPERLRALVAGEPLIAPTRTAEEVAA